MDKALNLCDYDHDMLRKRGALYCENCLEELNRRCEMKTMKKEIRFIGLDGKKYTFKTETNKLNNSQMFTIDDWKTCYSSDKREVNGTIKQIKELARW